MSHKQTSKRKGRKRAAAVLGAAGLLSLAGGASAASVSPTTDTLKEDASRHVITLVEEEVIDVSLTAFKIFHDKENARTQLAAQQGQGGEGSGCKPSRPARGCRGCRGCASTR